MRKIFLLIALIFLGYSGKAVPWFGEFTGTTGCIKYDAITGTLTLKVNYNYSGDWQYHANPYDTWAYVNVGGSSSTIFKGPFPRILKDPTTFSCEYDITPLLSTITQIECYDFFIAANYHYIPYAPPTDPDVSLPNWWIDYSFSPPRRWDIGYRIGSLGENYGWWRACLCDGSESIPKCNANFTLQIDHHSLDPASTTPPGFWPQTTVTVMPDEFHPTSTYLYNWGDGTTTTHPISKIYTTGPFSAGGTYTVCMTETMASGCVCTSCVSFCLPTTTALSAPCITPPSSGGSGSMLRKTDNVLQSLIEESVIYPNPAKNSAELSINLSKKESVAILINDISGKKVLEIPSKPFESGISKIQLNTEKLSSGIYQVQVLIGNKTTTHKLSIVK